MIIISLPCLLTLLLSCVFECDASMVVEVAYGKKECFRIRVPDDQPSIIRYVSKKGGPSICCLFNESLYLFFTSFIQRTHSIIYSLLCFPSSGNFDLLDDEVDGSYITAWITKIAGYRGVGATIWHSEEDEHEDDFSVNVEPVGKYELCFELETDPATDDYAESYAVGFNLRLTPSVARALDTEEKGPDTEKALELIESALKVETDWKNLVDHYVYLRNREASAVQLSQQIQDRVMGWTILEAVLVIGMAIGQVLYWKKFFETRRYL